MNRKLSVLFAVSAICVSLHAQQQYVDNGYYRMQNVVSSRYIQIIDDKAEQLDMHTLNPDLGALRTVQSDATTVSDPSMIMYLHYIKSTTKLNTVVDQTFNIYAQGVDIVSILRSFGDATVGYEGIRIKKVNGIYRAFQDASMGGSSVRGYLWDKSPAFFASSTIEAGALDPNKNPTDYAKIDWNIIAVNPDDASNYFGITPNVTVGNKYYYPLYMAFPFSFHSNGMKAYVVKQIDAENGICVTEELSGIVPGNTPVIIECSSASASGNRLQLEPIDSINCIPVAGNELYGTMFNTPDDMGIDEGTYHYRKISYNSSTMRVLGVTSEGKLGFVSAPAGFESIPANTSYLQAESLPAQLTLMNAQEYELFLGVDSSKADVKKVAWTLGGTSIEVNSLDELPRGLYIVDGHKYIVQ